MDGGVSGLQDGFWLLTVNSGLVVHAGQGFRAPVSLVTIGHIEKVKRQTE